MNLATQSWVFWECVKESKESLPLTEAKRAKGTGHGYAGFLRETVIKGCLFVCCLTSSYMLVYLKDESAQTIVRAATLR